ncbi:MAG TPA: CYTH domain-containing protein, partial [Ilumatobacteraceae bacterium]
MIEREIKLAADVGISMPDLADVLPGAEMGPVAVVHLDAVYYDTPTLSLARAGLTLRSRTGETGPIWTLKLPTP